MRWLTAMMLVGGLFVANDRTAAEVLYDGSLGTLPDAQGWSYASLPTGVVPTMDGSLAMLDTTANPVFHAGYAQIVASGLNRTTGYSIFFDVQVLSESHSSVDRAGFSVIALSSDKWGIELGFWTDTVWAQDDVPLFTKAESAAFDTTAAVTSYRLDVLGGTYSLKSGGSEILTGSLRDYATAVAPLLPDPLYAVYLQEDFLFFGDDTTSAQAKIGLGYVAQISEPSTLVLLCVGAVGLLGHAWRRRGNSRQVVSRKRVLKQR